MTFDLEQFIADCRVALTADRSHKCVREVVARVISDRSSVLKALGEPRCGAFQPLYRSNDLTIMKIIWAPHLMRPPHNHQMWGVIGIYTGREDNIFWRRVPGSQNGKLEAVGAKALCEGDAEPLGPNIIHSVYNPISRLTGAIHVYGGDFLAAPGRSEWDPETFFERPWDTERVARQFEQANDEVCGHQGEMTPSQACVDRRP